MLVLGRKRDEEAIITIPHGITIPKEGLTIHISVVDIRFDRVKLGFDASPNITIHRKEVQDQIDGQ